MTNRNYTSAGLLTACILLLSTGCNPADKKTAATATDNTELTDSARHQPDNSLRDLVAADDLKLGRKSRYKRHFVYQYQWYTARPRRSLL
jgi:hypothetical protein